MSQPGTTSLAASPRLIVVGLNHRTAPLEIRETLAFSPEQLQQAHEQFRRQFTSSELVILSTCNRVEMYVSRPVGDAPKLEQIAAFLADCHKLPPERLAAHLYHHEDRAMVEHLFRVASSLDSMVIGETQILAQVKEAYKQACDFGGIGSGFCKSKSVGAGEEAPHPIPHPDAGAPDSRYSGVFHTLFQRALAAAKEVHDQTGLAAGRTSIASVAVELARSVFDRFDDKTVLCIGAGKMSTLVLRHLQELRPKNIRIINRSPERAADLAAQFNALPADFAALDDLLTEADIILTSTGSSEPVVSTERFRHLLKARRYRPAVIVDIAVPRDVEAGVGQLNNVYLYNIDDLQATAAANRDRRGGQIEQSQALVQTHVEEFIRWYTSRDIGPLVKALFSQANAIAAEELSDYFARHPDLSESQRRDMERLAHRLVGKMLHPPVSHITHHAQISARPMLANALKKLFGLLENSTPNPTDDPKNKS